MTSRIDWLAIRTHYLASDTATLKSCADKFNTNYSSLRQKASDGQWSKEKERVRRNALSLLDNRTSEEIAKRNQEQIQLAQVLLMRAAQALATGIVPQNAKEIRSWIETGIKIERTASGMDNNVIGKVSADTPQAICPITY